MDTLACKASIRPFGRVVKNSIPFGINGLGRFGPGVYLVKQPAYGSLGNVVLTKSVYFRQSLVLETAAVLVQAGGTSPSK